MPRKPKGDKRVMVPSTIVGPLVEKLVEDRNYIHQETHGGVVENGGMAILAEQTGIPDRTLYDLKAQRRNSTLQVLDRILCGTDNEVLSWIPVEEGGFLEYYSENPPSVERALNADKMPPSSRPEKQMKGICQDCGKKCSRTAKRCWDCRWKSAEQKRQSREWGKRTQVRAERRARMLGNIGSDNTARYDSKRPDFRGDIDLSGIMSPS